MAGGSRKGPRVAIKAVAVEAGVSQATVSFVLNGPDDTRFNADTRPRALKAVNTPGHRRRIAGRPPKGSGDEGVGLMFDEAATGPIAALSIDVVQEQSWKHGTLVEMACPELTASTRRPRCGNGPTSCGGHLERCCIAAGPAPA
jgi:DNA-binding LacI/PurR family transcriptional regulator